MSQSLPQLVTTERELLNEEAWLVASLEKIKSHRISLQVERLQLQSMLNQKTAAEKPKTEQADARKDTVDERFIKVKEDHAGKKFITMQPDETVEDNPTTSAAIPSLEQLDQEESFCNNRELNLSIMNDINMLSGIYSNDNDLEEEESDDDEEDE